MVRNQYKVNLQPLHFVVLLAGCALVLLVGYGFRLIATEGRDGLSGNLLSREAPKPNAKLPTTAQSNLPPCPTTVTPMAQPLAQPGHHKVTLTWNASLPTSDPVRKTVGYCLYRSTTQGAAKQNPRCPNCEQINKLPIIGTGCVDDLVKDGTTYFYVATAINAGGILSTSSNETPAPIPATQQAASPVTVAPYPLCRASNGSQ